MKVGLRHWLSSSSPTSLSSRRAVVRGGAQSMPRSAHCARARTLASTPSRRGRGWRVTGAGHRLSASSRAAHGPRRALRARRAAPGTSRRQENERRCERGPARRLCCSRAHGLRGAEPDWRAGAPRRDMPFRHAGARDKRRHARAVRGGRHACGAARARPGRPPGGRAFHAHPPSPGRPAASGPAPPPARRSAGARARAHSSRGPGTGSDSAVGAQRRQPAGPISRPSAGTALRMQPLEDLTNLPCCAGTASPAVTKLRG